MSRLDQIRERAALKLTRDDYKNFRIADIARLRADIKRLLRLIDRQIEAREYDDLTVEEGAELMRRQTGASEGTDAEKSGKKGDE